VTGNPGGAGAGQDRRFAECPRAAAGIYYMFGGLASVVGMVQRITRSADAMLLPRRRRSWQVPYHPPTGPGLVRGRGLARRRLPALFPAEALTWIVATAAAAAILVLYVLFGL